jgi:hypothetical protein
MTVTKQQKQESTFVDDNQEILKVWFEGEGRFTVYIKDLFNWPEDWGRALGHVVKAAIHMHMERFPEDSRDEVLTRMQEGLMHVLKKGKTTKMELQ